MPECSPEALEKCKGECCNWLTFVFDNNPKVVEWCEARGMRVMQESDECIQVDLLHPCEHFKDGRCVLEKKPEGCFMYPAFDYSDVELDNNAGLTENCSCRFDEKEGWQYG